LIVHKTTVRAAQEAIPDGRIREIRLPDGPGYVQVRMWREGDFRSLGNNVVFVDRAGKAAAVDLYAAKPFANRFLQAMAALHYGEWGGPAYLVLYVVSGLASGLLLVTGALVWWLPMRKRTVLRKAA
jgi:uncharacterized iron-regulated membrane protein